MNQTEKLQAIGHVKQAQGLWERLRSGWDSMGQSEDLGTAGRGPLGSLGLSAVSNTPAQLYSLGLLGSGTLTGDSPGVGPEVREGLHKYMKDRDIRFAPFGNMPGFLSREDLKRMSNAQGDGPFARVKGLIASTIEGAREGGGLGDSIVGPKDMRPEILAHELGHSQQGWMRNRLGKGLYTLGKFAPAIAAPAALLAEDEDKGKMYAHMGALGSLPMLGIEIDASARGARLLRNQGVRGLKTLKTFKGVPSYALLAASPYLAHAMRKSPSDQFTN